MCSDNVKCLEEKLAVVGIYRRLQGNEAIMRQQGRIKKISKVVKKICRKETGKDISIILTGDFNAHNVVWNCYNTDFSGESLLVDTDSEDLYVINKDTMRLGNTVQRDSNIDLMFTNEKLMEKMSYEQVEDMWGSDHFRIIFELGIRKEIYKKKTNRRSTRRKQTFKSILLFQKRRNINLRGVNYRRKKDMTT